MSSEFAVSVRNAGKCFHIYDKPHDRLRQLLGVARGPLYREFWALRGVSFDVCKGETVGIVGCNGSGKSTLLQCICGTLSLNEGEISINGRIGALLELGAGFNLEFTGRENVYMNAAILGLTRAEIDAKYDEIADFADIGDFIAQPIKTYSSGMYVRLGFAVQACIDPDILVIDEALAVGDERFQRKCFARMEELKKKGTSILLVSHSAQNILDMCDRAMLMHRGEVIYSDSPLNTIQAYQKFIYAPPNKEEEALAQVKAFRLATAEVKATEVNAETVENSTSGPPPREDAAFFDPALMPETTVTYPIQGAEITEIIIQDLTGKRVNVLVRGREYVFVSRGRFLEDCRSVYFGIHIRLISGIGVTGQRYPGSAQSIDTVPANSNFEVAFKFRISLSAGAYFVGGGIWSYNEPQCLHRVLDKTMIKVLPVENDPAFGYFDASSGEAKLSLSQACPEAPQGLVSHI